MLTAIPIGIDNIIECGPSLRPYSHCLPTRASRSSQRGLQTAASTLIFFHPHLVITSHKISPLKIRFPGPLPFSGLPKTPIALAVYPSQASFQVLVNPYI